MTEISTLREIIDDGDRVLGSDALSVERSMTAGLVDRSKFEVIEVATGVRRCGKSQMMIQVGKRLLGAGKNVHYINFEDERLEPGVRDLTHIASMVDHENLVLLIDEPQSMPGWEKWTRRMHDKKIKVYVTGSNSKLLSGELATALTGRKKEHMVLPFSFSEYLSARGDERGGGEELAKGLDSYLAVGGFPYPTVTKDYDVLADYRSDIVERDILARKRISKPTEFRDFARFLLSHPGMYVSEKSLRGFIDLSHVTFKSYLSHMLDAFAGIALEKFAYSQKEQMHNPRKFYPMDNGLLIRREDRGRLLEGCIAQHLLRAGERFYYWKDQRGREVDFYLPDRKLAVQAVYELNRENVAREERALESAREALGAKPLMVRMYANADSSLPTTSAVHFLKWLEGGMAGRPY